VGASLTVRRPMPRPTHRRLHHSRKNAHGYKPIPLRTTSSRGPVSHPVIPTAAKPTRPPRIQLLHRHPRCVKSGAHPGDMRLGRSLGGHTPELSTYSSAINGKGNSCVALATCTPLSASSCAPYAIPPAGLLLPSCPCGLRRSWSPPLWRSSPARVRQLPLARPPVLSGHGRARCAGKQQPPGMPGLVGIWLPPAVLSSSQEL
jgi:hypothetical protein